MSGDLECADVARAPPLDPGVRPRKSEVEEKPESGRCKARA